MSDELEGLWREFEAETDDNIAALERLLTDRHEHWTREEVGALFRGFHSLKGAFGVMGMTHVEALSHHAEDLLALVRDGRVPLDEGLRRLLLAAVDRLKAMHEVVVSQRRDAPAADDLAAELIRHRDAMAPAAAPGPGPAPQLEPTGLDADPEMIALYCELLRERAEWIAGVLSVHAAERRAGADAAGELATGAQVLGFDGLAEPLQALASAAPDVDIEADIKADVEADIEADIEAASEEDPEAAGATDTDAHARAQRASTFESLAQLRSQLLVIQEVTGLAAGAAELAGALAPVVAPLLRQALAGLDAAQGDADAARATLRHGRALAVCAGHDGADRLLILLQEQFGLDASSEPARSGAARDCASRCLAALVAAADGGVDVAPDVVQDCTARWQACTAPDAGDAAARDASAPHAALRSEFRALLTSEQCLRIDQAVHGGAHVFEILVELEAEPQTAVGIMTWLASTAQTLTSRSVLDSTTHQFEFLVLSPEPIDSVRAQLAQLDPESVCVRAVRELGAVVPAPEPKATGAGSGAAAAGYLRVHGATIDSLMAEVGEMRTLIAALSEVVRHGDALRSLPALRRVADTLGADAAASVRTGADAAERDLQALTALEGRLQSSYRRIWNAGLKLRVVPVEAMFGRLTRAARELAQRLNKPLDVVVQGRDVRIDKSIVDLLSDPLMHMVRNALDHGIESAPQRHASGKPARARLVLEATERGNRVQIVISDDGRGLDRARILAKAVEIGLLGAGQSAQMSDRDVYRLILRPGFSTAESVTELSGRGVGMDVVDNTLQRLGGAIEVQTTLGAGTRFVMSIPISASLVRALMVEVGGQTYAIADRQVAAVMELDSAQIEAVGTQRYVGYHDVAVPVHPLARLLGLRDDPAERPARSEVAVVIATTGAAWVALEVDRIVRFQDLFLKDLHPVLARLPSIGGAAVLGDGRPVLVVDVQGLVDDAPGVARPEASPAAAS